MNDRHAKPLQDIVIARRLLPALAEIQALFSQGAYDRILVLDAATDHDFVPQDHPPPR
jgi:hypothetical protein